MDFVRRIAELEEMLQEKIYENEELLDKIEELKEENKELNEYIEGLE